MSGTELIPNRLEGTAIAYGDSVREDAAIVALEVIRHGSSSGWHGTVEQREAVAAVLAPFGIRYTDDMRGTWSPAKTKEVVIVDTLEPPTNPPPDPNVRPKLVQRATHGICFIVDGHFFTFTTAAWDVLSYVGSSGTGGRFLRGVEVRAARHLAGKGVITLEDDGPLKPGGRADGERWLAKLTELGAALVEHAS